MAECRPGAAAALAQRPPLRISQGRLLLAATLPASDDTAAARRQHEADALRRRLTRIAAAENAHALISTPSLCWATSSPKPPACLQQQLYQAFDLQFPYDSVKHQVSIRAVLTPATPAGDSDAHRRTAGWGCLLSLERPQTSPAI